MVKLLRAYGGCLGANRRRRTWQAAISLGKPQAGFITRGCPNGKTPLVVDQGSPPEFIGRRSQTCRSETSQYAEEKKANAIPSVVASERGTAQTGGIYPAGVVGARRGTGMVRRSFWKEAPKRVIAPYLKTGPALGIS